MQQNDKLYGLLKAIVFFFSLSVIMFIPFKVYASPPFFTDDPEPVEHRHGEFYLSSAYANNRDGEQGTAPHFEINYGIIPDVQLHFLFPFDYSHLKGGSPFYGIGDIEIGVKYRFIHETGSFPQVGTFPLVHFPTGDSDRGLGGGYTAVFIPVWLQKSFGPWTTYGGGGYWINPGTNNNNFWQFGWLIQRDITKTLTLGAEIYYFGKDSSDGRDNTGYNAGGIVNLSEAHHILFSIGSSIAGDNRLSAYLGYQWTFGPSLNEKK